MQKRSFRLASLSLFMALLMCFFPLFTGFASSASADGAEESLVYSSRNVLLKTADENVSLWKYDASAANKMGAALSLAKGPHGGTPDKALLTDGTISSTSTVKLVDGAGAGAIGWFVVDAGAKFAVERVLVDLCHDWGAGDLIIQLSTEPTFAAPVTIYNNDIDGSRKLGDTFTVDPSIGADDAVLFNKQNAGRSFSFAPVEARYIRVMCETYGNAKLQGYSCLGEIQMYAIEYAAAPKTANEVAPVLFSAPGGVYRENLDIALSTPYADAKIYYTTDGSCPTKASAVYSKPLNTAALPNACALRAVCEVNGVLGIPVHGVFAVYDPVTPENVALGKMPYAKSLDMIEDYYIAKDAATITDGTFDTVTNWLKKDYIGWVIVDLGKEYAVDSVQISFYLDHKIDSVCIQLSTKSDFSADVHTVYSNDAALAPVTTEETQWDNTDKNGRTIALDAPVNARYIRVTGVDRSYENKAFTDVNEIVVMSGGENVALKKTVTTKRLDWKETFSFENNAALVTDGIFNDQTNRVRQAGRGWVIIDLGAEYTVNSLQVSFWHDHKFDSSCVQLSANADFTDAYTVYSNDAKLAPVTDSGKWENVNAKGKTFTLKTPVDARYVRVTCDENSYAEQSYTSINEIAVFAGVKFEPNVALGKTAYVKSMDMQEDLKFSRGPAMVTDGKFTTDTNYIQLRTAEGEPAVDANGWTIVDFGKVYTIGSVQISYWHDNHFTHACIQLSTTADFSEGVTTVYCNDADLAEPTTAETEWANVNAQGKTLELSSPAAARYIRVTGRRREANSRYCMINEIVVNQIENKYQPAPALQDYAASAADEFGMALPKVSVANGTYFTEALAKLPSKLQLTSSKGVTSDVEGTWRCESFSKDTETGETKVGDYDFYFVFDDGNGTLPADLYGVAKIVVTVEGAADVAALQAAIAAAESKAQAEFTTSSFAAMQGKLDAAKELSQARTKTQEQVNAAADALTAATKALAVKGDIAELTELYNSVKGKIQTEYTISSWAPFKEALDKAGELLAKEDKNDIAKTDADAAYAALFQSGLEKRGNITELKARYDEAKKTYGTETASDMYTAKTWTDYLEAMLAAEAGITDNSDLNQTAVDALVADLGTAAGALEEKADKTQITALAAQYRADEKKYTKASWKEFVPVLAETESAVNGEDMTAAELKIVADKLSAAAEKLVVLGDGAKLSELILKAVDAEKYQSAGYLAYLSALEEAKLVANREAAQTEIDAAYEKLDAAVKALVSLGDKTELKALVEQAKGEKKIGKALAEKLNAAQEVLGDAEASEEEVGAAYAALQAALNENGKGCSSSVTGAVSITLCLLLCGAAIVLTKKKAR